MRKIRVVPSLVVALGVMAMAPFCLEAKRPEHHVVGNVRVVPIDAESQWNQESLERLDHESGTIISVSESYTDDSSRLRQRVLYDTQRQAMATILEGKAFDLDALNWQRIQPHPADSELDQAVDYILQHGNLEMPDLEFWLGDDGVEVYPAMPPIHVDEFGTRHINVSIYDPATEYFEIISVLLDAENSMIVRHPDGAPDRAKYRGSGICGVSAVSCNVSNNTGPGRVYVEWPEENPIWKFEVIRPRSSSGVYGSGIELVNVHYQDRLVMARGHMPFLNVEYEGNQCGPFRDWLNSEQCFESGGEQPINGFYFPTEEAPATICQTSNDSGNARGVAIYDGGDSLTLMSELQAGWYRYGMYWTLYADGRIEPKLDFGSTINSCVCVPRWHHGYWRFEWAIDGIADIPNTGFTEVERFDLTTESWEPVTVEQSFIRQPNNLPAQRWRFRNPQSQTSWTLTPDELDHSAVDDEFAVGDEWVLALNSGELDDDRGLSHGTAMISLERFVNNEPIGEAKRTVFWYRVGSFRTGDDGQKCAGSGPVIQLENIGGPVPTPPPTPTPAPPPNFSIAADIPTPLTIPDNDPTGLTSQIVVEESGLIANLEIFVQINHTWVGDLSFSLTHERTGKMIELANPSSNCNGDNIVVTLSDFAEQAVATACQSSANPAISGTFRPNQPLGTFFDDDILGTWSLNIRDSAGGDIGTLVAWGMDATLYQAPPPTPQAWQVNPVLHVQVASPFILESGKPASYLYQWESENLDITVTNGPTPSLEDMIYHNQDGVSLQAGDRWTITITPMDGDKPIGEPKVGIFQIGHDNTMIFEGWLLN